MRAIYWDASVSKKDNSLLQQPSQVPCWLLIYKYWRNSLGWRELNFPTAELGILRKSGETSTAQSKSDWQSSLSFHTWCCGVLEGSQAWSCVWRCRSRGFQDIISYSGIDPSQHASSDNISGIYLALISLYWCHPLQGMNYTECFHTF